MTETTKTTETTTAPGTEPARKSAGRPRKGAAPMTPAERQKAYRQRLKKQGKRVVSRVVRDVRNEAQPLVSDVLDLSAVRGARGV